MAAGAAGARGDGAVSMGSGGFGDRFLELVIGDVPNFDKPAASPIGSRWLAK